MVWACDDEASSKNKSSKSIVKFMEINVGGKKGRGRPKKRWLDTYYIEGCSWCVHI